MLAACTSRLAHVWAKRSYGNKHEGGGKKGGREGRGGAERGRGAPHAHVHVHADAHPRAQLSCSVPSLLFAPIEKSCYYC